MAAAISTQTDAPSYSPPSVPSNIKYLGKIYFIAGQPFSSVTLVFTDQKTRNAANKAFKADYQFFHSSIPLSDQLQDKLCLTYILAPHIFGNDGFLISIQKILTCLGKQLEKSEQAANIPILLALADSDPF